VSKFVAVVEDPTGATEGELVAMHTIEPYRTMLDPNGSVARLQVAGTNRVAEECVTGGEESAAWDCEVRVGTETCRVAGGGTRNGDGTMSGNSTLTCPNSVLSFSATDLAYDQGGGTANGTLQVSSGNPAQSVVEITFAVDEFCSKGSRLPASGSLTVDGKGPFEGLPYDELILTFHDVIVCGDAWIE
jgi:hypothetical protein